MQFQMHLLVPLKKAEGQIRVNAPVQKIIVKNGKAVGVVIEGGEEVYASIVVSNLDAKRTKQVCPRNPECNPQAICFHR